MDVINKITEICNLLDEIDGYFASIPSKQSENDMAISDLYHYIENNQISTKGSYRIVKELREHLLIRRNLKEDQELLRTFVNHKNKLNLPENRQMLLGEVNKTKNRLLAAYNYRIYDSEESLKERIEH